MMRGIARFLRGIALFLCLLWGQAWAGPAVYWVDCDATVNGTGTLLSPFWGVSTVKGNNLDNNFTWATVDTDNADILFKSGSTCDNSELGGTGGFPSVVIRAGISSDHIRIGVYDPATGNEILTPTVAQMVKFQGDGTTRAHMLFLSGFTYTTVTGIDCSGGSAVNACLRANGSGTTAPKYVTFRYSRITQGSTPAAMASFMGAQITGIGSQADTGDNCGFDNMIVTGLSSAGSTTGLNIANIDYPFFTNNNIDASTFTYGGSNAISMLGESSTELAKETLGTVVTGNTIKGGTHGWRSSPYGANVGSKITETATISGNTFTDVLTAAVYTNAQRGTIVENNTMVNTGRGLGVGAGVYMQGQSLVYDGSNFENTYVRNNTITNSAQFGIHIVGTKNLFVDDNIIAGCGTVPQAGTGYGRCIEVTAASSGSTVRGAYNMTLSAASGVGVTATAAAATFTDTTHRDWCIVSNGLNKGACCITGITSSTVATCDVISKPFVNTTLVSDTNNRRWHMGNFSRQIKVRGNETSGAKHILMSGGFGDTNEGVGIGIDDQTVVWEVSGNYSHDNDFQGMSTGGGVNGVISGNLFKSNGADPYNFFPVWRWEGSPLTISAANADNSFNDSTNNFHILTGANTSTAGLTVGQQLVVQGFTGGAVSNNRTWTVVSQTIGKIVVSGGTVVTQASGDPVRFLTYPVGTARASGRKTQILVSGSPDVEVYNNTVDCGTVPDAYGISQQNSADNQSHYFLNGSNTAGPVSVYNNTVKNCRSGLVLDSGDLASHNSFYNNQTNYEWQAQMFYFSIPAASEMTTQTLDGASLTADPQHVGGSNPSDVQGFRLKSTSPLRRAGKDLNIGTYQDALGRGYLHPPSIGGLEATSGVEAAARTAR